MKKITAAALALLLLLSLAACGREQKQVGFEHYAIIIDVDPDNRTLLVRDPGDEKIFGKKTTIDCTEAPVRPRGSDSQELSFLDLEPGDRILLTFGDEGRKTLSKGKPMAKAATIRLVGGE